MLAGQSYGGIVVTGVADRVPERLAHLIYLDALVAEEGQCVFDLLPPPIRANSEESAWTGDGFRVPPLPFEDDPRVAAFVRGRYVASPLRMFAEPIQLTRPPDPRLGRTYIWCTEDQEGLPLGFSAVTWPFAERARDDPAWTLHQLTAMHDAFIELPERIAEILTGAAPCPGRGGGAARRLLVAEGGGDGQAER